MWDMEQLTRRPEDPRPTQQQALHAHVGARLLNEGSTLHFFKIRNTRTGGVTTVFSLPRDANLDRNQIEKFAEILEEWEGRG